MAGPLKGVRVLDLSRILAGPFCSMILGDLGAEVIKVERPGCGDDTRTWGPPFIAGESTYFLSINRSKRSITIDLKSRRGVEIVKELAKKSDILIENFPPGTMEEFGLDYETLRSLNPRLIYCSVTGFGPDGPYRNRTGYDLVASAVGGLMSITGDEGGPPVKVGIAITDVVTGLYANGAVVAALHARSRTGVGQRIDISLLEAQVAALINAASAYLNTGFIHRRLGTAHESIVPYQGFRVKDKYMVIAVGNDKIFANLCHALNLPHLLDEPKFRTNADRVKNRRELVTILGCRLLEKSCDEWMELFEKYSIPAGPVNSIDEVFRDPQVLHRRMLLEMAHPKAGKVRMAGIPVKYSETKAEAKLPPPLLGEHTEEILKNILEYNDMEIERLRKEKII
ncbi:MAG: CaiB/BaiF CoA-transferase family protein [Acidobacteriota bacterium]